MKHYIENNIYYLKTDEEDLILKISLPEDFKEQIIIETRNEVFSGNPDLISFNPNPTKNEK